MMGQVFEFRDLGTLSTVDGGLGRSLGGGIDGGFRVMGFLGKSKFELLH